MNNDHYNELRCSRESEAKGEHDEVLKIDTGTEHGSGLACICGALNYLICFGGPFGLITVSGMEQAREKDSLLALHLKQTVF